jgi:exosortase K
MKEKFSRRRIAQCVAVLVCAYTLKLGYSTASVDELGWILVPTTALVELLSGVSFAYEAHAGYFSRERNFLIAGSCAGVNFLFTAFLLLALNRLIRERSQRIEWSFIPAAAVIAFLATLVANTARITLALRLQSMSAEINWLTAEQLHRLEGIIIYFGCLLLLFVVSEKMNAEKDSGLWRQPFLPLLLYYAVMLGIPLLNQASGRNAEFREHSLFVLLIPLLLILPLAVFRFFRA